MGENRSLSNGQEGNVPKLRFPGFEGEWTSKQFGDIFSFLPNNTLSRAELVTDGEVLNIHYGDILTKYTSILNAEYDEIPSIVLGKESKGCSYLQDGDIVIADTAEDETAGKALEIININGRKIESGLHTIPCHPNYSYAPMYLGYYINSAHFHKQLIPLMQGIKVLSVSKSNISKTIISAPNTICEQEKTAFILHLLDCRIKKQQQVIETLKKYKRGLLSSMFPEKGEAIPKHRFSGFTEPWEQRKLSELIIEYKETVESDCELPVLTSSKTEGVLLQEEHFGRKQSHDITGYNVLPRNYCTYRNRSDGIDFTFNINKCCDKGIISKFYPVFCGNGNDTFFISLMLNNSDEVVREIGYTCIGTGQKVLAFSDLLKMYLRVPIYEEQKKIAAYFDNLDHLITLHHYKLKMAIKLKESLLQQLFI